MLGFQNTDDRSFTASRTLTSSIGFAIRVPGQVVPRSIRTLACKSTRTRPCIPRYDNDIEYVVDGIKFQVIFSRMLLLIA